MAETAAEEALEQLKQQKWVLKVPIHCEGCKMQVKKVIKSIDGVYTIDVDSQQQKVTVTGNVNAETLIKKLVKTGKRAELWPEKPAGGNSKSNKKQNVPKSEGGDNSSDRKKNSEEKKTDGSTKKGEERAREEAADKTGGNGGGKKKKGKRGIIINPNIDNGSSGNAPAGTGFPAPTLYPNFISPPPQFVPPYAPVYYMPSPLGPNYHNAAHPSTSASCSVSPLYANAYSAATTYQPASANRFDGEDGKGECSLM